MELFIANLKIIITDLTTEKEHIYYKKDLKWSDFIDFVEKVKNELNLKNDEISVDIEMVDKAICYFD
jgi:hypothetical protein